MKDHPSMPLADLMLDKGRVGNLESSYYQPLVLKRTGFLRAETMTLFLDQPIHRFMPRPLGRSLPLKSRQEQRKAMTR